MLGYPSQDIEDLIGLFSEVVAVAQKRFVIIDSLDECTKPERDTPLRIVQMLLTSSRNPVAVFLATRDNITREVEAVQRKIGHVSTNSPELHSALTKFIQISLDEKHKSRKLVVGSPELLKEVKIALIEGAQGMFVPSFGELQPSRLNV